MNDTVSLLGACGLYCGACPHLAGAASADPEIQGCQGCRGDSECMHPWCAECGIRDCADEKGYLHCGECSDFPCERLEAFRRDGKPHHADITNNLLRINEAGSAQWLAEQKERWTCICGTSFSWYQGLCYSCGETVPSYVAEAA
ncbi:MAG TPA: DUF3795 domain-containing protein [Bryobacteraceae bacterium]|nr:DUF3795 domain-containing protein [Bryobacteraceae bacterium]